MKNNVLLPICALLLLSCQPSKEEKIDNLVFEYFTEHKDSFPGYEPIETIVDSFITTIYTDPTVGLQAEKFDNAQENVYKKLSPEYIVDDDGFMCIYTPSGKDIIKKRIKEARYELDLFNALLKKFTPVFLGWTVTHKFISNGQNDVIKFIVDKEFDSISVQKIYLSIDVAKGRSDNEFVIEESADSYFDIVSISDRNSSGTFFFQK